MTETPTTAEIRRAIIDSAWRRFDDQAGETYPEVCQRFDLPHSTHWAIYCTLAFDVSYMKRTRADFDYQARMLFQRMDLVEAIRRNITHFTYRIDTIPAKTPRDMAFTPVRYVGYVELNQSIRVGIDTGFVVPSQPSTLLGSVVTTATRTAIARVSEFDWAGELLDYLHRNQQSLHRWYDTTVELKRLFDEAGVIVDAAESVRLTGELNEHA